MTGKLMIMVGLPRAGKSTFANDWQQKPDPDCHKVIVNPDYIRAAVWASPFDPNQINSILNLAIDMITKAMVKSLYYQGYYVCIDAVNCYVNDIKYWLSLDKNAQFKYVYGTPSESKSRAKTLNLDLEGMIDAVHRSLQELAWLSKDSWEVKPQGYATCDQYLPLEERIYKSLERIRNGG